jgi:hypothetical protein
MKNLAYRLGLVAGAALLTFRQPKEARLAALYVATGGPYSGLPGVDPWDVQRDARQYPGPYPVVAHPPCERWGRYWSGNRGIRSPYKMGADGGCFAAALATVRKWGGVIEHCEGSLAWRHNGFTRPPRSGGWIPAGDGIGWTCCVEQGHYGHLARKRTWLYVVHCELPDLTWGIADVSGSVQNLSKRQREFTPIPFRDLLLKIARTAKP